MQGDITRPMEGFSRNNTKIAIVIAIISGAIAIMGCLSDIPVLRSPAPGNILLKFKMFFYFFNCGIAICFAVAGSWKYMEVRYVLFQASPKPVLLYCCNLKNRRAGNVVM